MCDEHGGHTAVHCYFTCTLYCTAPHWLLKCAVKVSTELHLKVCTQLPAVTLLGTTKSANTPCTSFA